MSYELSQEKLQFFARNATCYELVQPIINVGSDGQVRRV